MVEVATFGISLTEIMMIATVITLGVALFGSFTECSPSDVGCKKYFDITLLPTGVFNAFYLFWFNGFDFLNVDNCASCASSVKIIGAYAFPGETNLTGSYVKERAALDLWFRTNALAYPFNFAGNKIEEYVGVDLGGVTDFVKDMMLAFYSFFVGCTIKGAFFFVGMAILVKWGIEFLKAGGAIMQILDPIFRLLGWLMK